MVSAVTIDDTNHFLEKFRPMFDKVRRKSIHSFRHDIFINSKKYFTKEHADGKIVEKEIRRHHLQYYFTSAGFPEDVLDRILDFLMERYKKSLCDVKYVLDVLSPIATIWFIQDMTNISSSEANYF